MSSFGMIRFRTKVMNHAWTVITCGLSLVLMLSVRFPLGWC